MTVAAEAPAQKNTETYDWLRNWYPVNVLDTMDPEKPHAVTLLGLNLVAWNDGPTVDGAKTLGQWRVFDDACPHRLGPLYVPPETNRRERAALERC
jgi:phenylpropionate dioxygenase-like ring-hydroxylating dioxygenase large terminal subunit